MRKRLASLSGPCSFKPTQAGRRMLRALPSSVIRAPGQGIVLDALIPLQSRMLMVIAEELPQLEAGKAAAASAEARATDLQNKAVLLVAAAQGPPAVS